VIEPELAAFLEGDVGFYVGSVDVDGTPSAGRAWGLRVERDIERIRLLVGADRVTLANLKSTGRVAVTATDVATYRSVQLKGTATAVESLDPIDHATHERYRRIFTEAVAAIDAVTPMDAVWPRELVAVIVSLDAIFDQTPGPNAGRAIEAMTA
jgi:hypothetical protein